MKKLKITDEEIQEEAKINLDKLTPKQKETLEKDFQANFTTFGENYLPFPSILQSPYLHLQVVTQ